MKDQYVGDINDFRKYGLLRVLTGFGLKPATVCWMLTPSDGSSDGKKINYLDKPRKWRPYDPDLFDCLKCIVKQNRRNVKFIETSNLLHNCRFHTTILSDQKNERECYFKELAEIAEGSNLVFFDPDNGFEVKSKPLGRKGSSKYLYWHEVRYFYSKGYSLLIYQHFPMVKKDQFIKVTAKELAGQTKAKEVLSFQTPHVAFFLASQSRDQDFFRRAAKEVESRWGNQIVLKPHDFALKS